ncbi:MAG: hypothetical protein PHF89_00320 [Eubacteriales bacterium]|jgi:ATPase subunit of ABC transporter with duplicated ATPase domains|nr:hypothetical protein [Eubacteriales bacterium]
MAGKIIKYYTDGNTSKGFISLLHSNLCDVDNLLVLKGPLGMEFSDIINEIAKDVVSKNCYIEFMYTPEKADSVRGIKVPDKNIAVVDGRNIEDIAGKNSRFYDLTEFILSETVRESKDYIARLEKEIESLKSLAYLAFADALKIHDEWESIYISNMNFEKADDIAKKMINEMLSDTKEGKKQITYHRFLGAATPYGSRDFIQNLTEGINKRYFIKGRPGSGKSTMLKAILKEAESRNITVEVYHCGFDPNSLDMLILRSESAAIFDSTAPHEYFPERKTDTVVDMYYGAIETGTDEKFEEKLENISQRYSEKMKEGTNFLLKARKETDILEKIYKDAEDISLRESFIEKIKSDIFKTTG